MCESLYLNSADKHCFIRGEYDIEDENGPTHRALRA